MNAAKSEDKYSQPRLKRRATHRRIVQLRTTSQRIHANREFTRESHRHPEFQSSIGV